MGPDYKKAKSESCRAGQVADSLLKKIPNQSFSHLQQQLQLCIYTCLWYGQCSLVFQHLSMAFCHSFSSHPQSLSAPQAGYIGCYLGTVTFIHTSVSSEISPNCSLLLD